MSNHNDQGPSRWDPICIALITLATASLVALFTLVGFAGEVLTSGKFRNQATLVGTLAIVAYFVCLASAFGALFSDEYDRKRNKAQEAAGLFAAEVLRSAA